MMVLITALWGSSAGAERPRYLTYGVVVVWILTPPQGFFTGSYRALHGATVRYNALPSTRGTLPACLGISPLLLRCFRSRIRILLP